MAGICSSSSRNSNRPPRPWDGRLAVLFRGQVLMGQEGPPPLYRSRDPQPQRGPLAGGVLGLGKGTAPPPLASSQAPITRSRSLSLPFQHLGLSLPLSFPAGPAVTATASEWPLGAPTSLQMDQAKGGSLPFHLLDAGWVGRSEPRHAPHGQGLWGRGGWAGSPGASTKDAPPTLAGTITEALGGFCAPSGQHRGSPGPLKVGRGPVRGCWRRGGWLWGH